MRILYLHQYFATPSMPGGTRSYELARRFVAAGHQVHMITSDQRGEAVPGEWRRSEEAGIHVHWVGNPYDNRMSSAERIQAFCRFAWMSARRAASIPCDLVLATSTPLTIALPGAFAAARHRVPMVFEVRDLWPELPIAVGTLANPLARWAARGLERFAYGQSRWIVSLSPDMREGVLSTGFPRSRISVLPNSCDLDFFKVDAGVGCELRASQPWLGDRPLVVYAGTLGRINGVGYLVRVAARMLQIDPEVRFWVVGDGRERESVRDLAGELGVLDRNFFMSESLPKDQMPALLSAADVACSLFIDLPAMRANSANKFFDALASRTAVAINYGGWQAELLEQTSCGIRMSPSDPGSAARELHELLIDGERRDRAAEHALSLGRERFDRNVLAARYEEILRRVVEQNQTSSTRVPRARRAKEMPTREGVGDCR